MINMDSNPKRREKVLTQEASDALVLLPLDNGEYYALNEVGARVWALCDGTHSVAEMVNIIAQEYEAPGDVIKADVLDLLTELSNEQLLVKSA